MVFSKIHCKTCNILHRLWQCNRKLYRHRLLIQFSDIMLLTSSQNGVDNCWKLSDDGSLRASEYVMLYTHICKSARTPTDDYYLIRFIYLKNSYYQCEVLWCLKQWLSCMVITCIQLLDYLEEDRHMDIRSTIKEN